MEGIATVSKQRIDPPNAPRPNDAHTYAQVVRAGNFVFLAGQVPRDGAGDIVGKGDILAQTEQVFRNIQDCLKAAGTSIEHTVKMTVFLANIDHLPVLYEVRRRYLKDPATFPACACIEAKRLADPDYLIEVEAIAVVP